MSPFVSSLLDYQPLARQATTNFLRGLAQVVIQEHVVRVAVLLQSCHERSKAWIS